MVVVVDSAEVKVTVEVDLVVAAVVDSAAAAAAGWAAVVADLAEVEMVVGWVAVATVRRCYTQQHRCMLRFHSRLVG